MWSGIASSLLFVLLAGVPQAQRGSISGKVTDPDLGAVTGALVQAKQNSTGTVFRATSSRTGEFTISGLPAGVYEISVPEVGFKFDRYVRKDISVQSGQTLRHDVRLNWGNLGVEGDDVYLEVHNRNAKKKFSGKAPRMANGKPDLSGVWLGTRDLYPEQAEALPWAEAKQKERFQNYGRDVPSADCLPGDVIPSSPLPYKIVQTNTLIVQLFDMDPHFRQIYLDGQVHPKDLDPTWTGHSIGKWEGDTLVIDTLGFNDKGWLPNLMPHTEKLHVVERYLRPDLAHLNVEITLEDPDTLKKPWHIRMVWEWAPDEDIPETVCNENNHYRELAPGK
jgi:Carboxypeptidase regulatory-like domain